MQQRHAYSSLIFIMLVMWSMSPGVAAERGPLWELAVKLCKDGKAAQSARAMEIFGFKNPIWLIREANSGRLVFVPESQCRDDRPAETQSFLIVMERVYRERRPIEGNHFLTSLRGELIDAVYGVAVGDDTKFSRVDVTDQIRSEFEAEKRYWLTKYGLPVQ